jgi:endonuclease YncB( thermonuclease family)
MIRALVIAALLGVCALAVLSSRSVIRGTILGPGPSSTSGLAAAAIVGVPCVLNGDSINIGTERIRLAAIDAPEWDQVCLDQVDQRWACGAPARDRLPEHIAARQVACDREGTDKYQRTLAVCRLADEDLNGWLVRQGWALAYVAYSRAYVAEEAEARREQRGMWAGAFIAPWDWRHHVQYPVIRGHCPVGGSTAPTSLHRRAPPQPPPGSPAGRWCRCFGSIPIGQSRALPLAD